MDNVNIGNNGLFFIEMISTVGMSSDLSYCQSGVNLFTYPTVMITTKK